MKKLVITLEIKDDSKADDVLKDANGLLFNDHPWLPGGFFSDVTVKEVFLAPHWDSA